MFFAKLGVVNAYRNLTRSSIAILAMFVAGAFLTSAVSMSRGYPQAIKKDYRAVLGGEIIIYELSFEAKTSKPDTSWFHQTLVSSPLTDLEVFHPQLFTQGFLSEISSLKEATRFTAEDYHKLETWPSVQCVYPRYQLPAVLLTNVGSKQAPIRGRDYDLDKELAFSPEELVSEGRWFTQEDDGQAVAIVSLYQKRNVGERPVEIDQVITIQLPRVVYRDDEIYFDYLYPIEKSLTVIGAIEVETRLIGSGEMSPGEEYTQAHLYLDEIQVPLTTWQTIWHEMGGSTYHAEQLMLIIKDIGYLEDTVQSLKTTFPEYTIFVCLSRPFP